MFALFCRKYCIVLYVLLTVLYSVQNQGKCAEENEAGYTIDSILPIQIALNK